MKKIKLELGVFVLLFFVLSNLQAQEAVSAVGGEATGGGGTVSYTMGQVVYTTQTGIGGKSVAQGVQQPYEISVVTGIAEAEGISLKVLAYPNPTTDYITIEVDASTTISIQKLQYLFFDISGKLLQTVKATGLETKIETNNLVTGSYFVKVIDRENEIKVFKIVKN